MQQASTVHRPDPNISICLLLVDASEGSTLSDYEERLRELETAIEQEQQEIEQKRSLRGN